MLILAIREGGVKCSSACPWQTDSGIVRGCRDMPLQTHCRMVMHPWMVDCDVYNPNMIDKMEVTEDEWRRMQKSIGRPAIRQIKLFPEDHAEIHAVGCEWTRAKGRFNAEKSGKIMPE